MKFTDILGIITAIGLILFCIFFSGISEANQDFQKAKVIADQKIFTGNLMVDIYCGCRYNQFKQIDTSSCNYKSNKVTIRTYRIEWEHVVPASLLGNDMTCWSHGGRKNCAKSNEFASREGDLHNLRPAIGLINQNRSNYQYGIIDNKIPVYGKCKSFVNYKNNVFEPRDQVKGNVARITLYMNDKYNLQLGKDYIYLLKKWSDADPVDYEEKEINRRIKMVQGDSNPYIGE